MLLFTLECLTHWGRVMHICISKIISIGSDNGLCPSRRQATIWTSAGILSIGPLGTNFSEIWIKVNTFSFKKMHLKISSGKWWPYCLSLNVLNCHGCMIASRGQFNIKTTSYQSRNSHYENRNISVQETPAAMIYSDFYISLISGPWFNVNISHYQYRKSHCVDKMFIRSFYLHNQISQTAMLSSYWFSPCFLQTTVWLYLLNYWLNWNARSIDQDSYF